MTATPEKRDPDEVILTRHGREELGRRIADGVDRAMNGEPIVSIPVFGYIGQPSTSEDEAPQPAAGDGAQTATLNYLIEKHRATAAAFDAAAETLEAMEGAYKNATEFNLIKVQLCDVSPSVNEGREWLRGYADDIIDRCRRQVPMISNLSPEFAAQFEAFIAATQDALYQKIDEALDREERRQKDFGLTAAQENWDRLSDAEADAIGAIASYRCKDHDEERRRIAYLISTSSALNSLDDIAPMLIEAVGGNKDGGEQ